MEPNVHFELIGICRGHLRNEIILEMIRKAEKRDIPALIELLGQVNDVHAEGRPDLFMMGHTKYDAAELEALLEDPDRPVFVAEDESGKVVGYSFSVIQRYPEGGHLRPHLSLYIDDICVDANCRGRGVGRSLYDYTANFAKNIGCYNITLNVWAANHSARRFYESLGLKVQKTTMEQLL